jgi:PAS domain S-box-containing protein
VGGLSILSRRASSRGAQLRPQREPVCLGAPVKTPRISSTLRSVALLVLALLLVAAAGALSYRSSVDVANATVQGARTQQIAQQARLLLVLVTDAETGQRGYLLTGEAAYLEPYQRAVAALPAALARFQRLTQDDPEQVRRVASLRVLIDRKLAELDATVVARRTAGLEAALAVVRTGEGQGLMNDIRHQIAATVDEASRALAARQREVARSTRRASDATIAGLLLAVGVTVVAGLLIVAGARRREREQAALRAQRTRDEAAERLAAVIESSDDAIVAKDLNGVITAWNPAAERIFGYRVAEAVGRSITLIIPPDRWAEEDMVLGRIRRGERVNHFDTVRLTKDGRAIDVSVTVSPVRGANGVVVGASKIARDVTERKRAEAELKEVYATLEERVIERTQQLAEINAELDAFGYTVSHDLRAPLRAMNGFASALLEDYGATLGAQGQDYARRIVDAAERLDQLIQDLLAYSRLSRGELHPEPLRLDDVVAEALRTLEPDIRARAAAIEVAKPLRDVVAHRETLRNALLNLVGNALKFVAPGVKPHIRLWSEPRDGRRRLWVEDNGIGIDPQYHGTIFRVFHRLHGIESYPGTGIGLAIVRRGVERMGGRVGVESSAGAGARFWIELVTPGGANGS